MDQAGSRAFVGIPSPRKSETGPLALLCPTATRAGNQGACTATRSTGRPHVGTARPDRQCCAEKPHPAGGGVFIKQRCEKHTPERDLMVEAHFLRKPGQSDIDPATGDYTSGQFESWTRFELLDPNYKK
jgi:hypothetical protein